MVDLSSYGEVVEQGDSVVRLRAPKVVTATVTRRILTDLPIADLAVKDPPIDEVIELVFSQNVEG